MNPNNPYAAPQSDWSSSSSVPPNVDVSKVEAIIKDAGQFWLAILMCVFCTALGSVIIGPWYLVRLLQWKSIAREHPLLLDRNVARGSLAQRFQSARVKLIIGLTFGLAIFFIMTAFVVVAIATAPR